MTSEEVQESQGEVRTPPPPRRQTTSNYFQWTYSLMNKILI